MRILSESEYQRIPKHISDVPLELAEHYFTAQLRAEVPDSGRDLSDETLRGILETVMYELNAERLLLKDTNHMFDDYARQQCSYKKFNLRDSSPQTRRTTKVVQFPLQNLLFRKDLEPFGITPEPGYLYFGCTAKRQEESVIYDDRQVAAQYSLAQDRINESFDGDVFDQLIIVTKEGDKLMLPAHKGNAGKPLKRKNTFIGFIGDIAHVTNSVVIAACKSPGSKGPKYILKTPMEFPHGFVRETADLLRSEWRRTTPLVEKFCNLVFEKNEPTDTPDGSGELLAVGEFNKGFPHGEPLELGPDSWWKYSSDPWFVQTILLARLTGGQCWQYALGALEQYMQESIE